MANVILRFDGNPELYILKYPDGNHSEVLIAGVICILDISQLPGKWIGATPKTPYYLSLAEQSSSDWHVIRAMLKLTGSKFGTLIAVQRGECPPSWLEPCKVVNEAMRLGSLLESPIREQFKSIVSDLFYSGQKVDVLEMGLAIPEWNPLIGVSIDGLVVNEEGKPLAIIEIKTMFEIPERYKTSSLSMELGQPPEHYRSVISTHHYGQMQGGMQVFNLPYCFYICYGRKLGDMWISKIPRDDEYWKSTLYPAILEHIGFKA